MTAIVAFVALVLFYRLTPLLVNYGIRRLRLWLTPPQASGAILYGEVLPPERRETVKG